MDLVAFYSWQSDLPPRANRSLIERALKQALATFEGSRTDLEIAFDRDTAGVGGAPGIADTILAKIDRATVVISDVSIVNARWWNGVPNGAALAENGPRLTPNPNVLLELGYAVARVGWHRAVLVCNTAYGPVEELPFALRHRRVMTYSFDPAAKDADSGRKQVLKELTDKLSAAIQQILDDLAAAPVPAITPGLTAAERRSRDLQTLEGLLRSIHTPTWDMTCEQAGVGFLPDEIFWFWESFNEVVGASRFHLFDPDLAAYVTKLRETWSALLGFGDWFAPRKGGRGYYFMPAHEAGGVDANAAARGRFDAALAAFEQGSRDFLGYVRDRFQEIDLPRTDAEAWHRYREFEASLGTRA